MTAELKGDLVVPSMYQPKARQLSLRTRVRRLCTRKAREEAEAKAKKEVDMKAHEYLREDFENLGEYKDYVEGEVRRRKEEKAKVSK